MPVLDPERGRGKFCFTERTVKRGVYDRWVKVTKKNNRLNTTSYGTPKLYCSNSAAANYLTLSFFVYFGTMSEFTVIFTPDVDIGAFPIGQLFRRSSAMRT